MYTFRKELTFFFFTSPRNLGKLASEAFVVNTLLLMFVELLRLIDNFLRYWTRPSQDAALL